jgi:hypothetical protein
MTWFTFISSLVQFFTILLREKERNTLISEIESVERARVIAKLNASLIEAAKIPSELQGLNEKELDEYVQNKGWYRD